METKITYESIKPYLNPVCHCYSCIGLYFNKDINYCDVCGYWSCYDCGEKIINDALEEITVDEEINIIKTHKCKRLRTEEEKEYECCKECYEIEFGD